MNKMSFINIYTLEKILNDYNNVLEKINNTNSIVRIFLDLFNLSIIFYFIHFHISNYIPSFLDFGLVIFNVLCILNILVQASYYVTKKHKESKLEKKLVIIKKEIKKEAEKKLNRQTYLIIEHHINNQETKAIPLIEEVAEQILLAYDFQGGFSNRAKLQLLSEICIEPEDNLEKETIKEFVEDDYEDEGKKNMNHKLKETVVEIFS